ncbi:MAG TPA: VWA domain-containing protein [Candidatus Glassbacteria bacterium]|nr:VWA domain-containing protein [Candidatus Glassbacteria bacterium]
MTLIPNTKWEVAQKSRFQEKHTPFQNAVNDGTDKGYEFNDFSQDLFSSLYQINPEFPEKATPGTGWAKKALDELKSLPEFRQIRETGTKCDSFQSGLGATILSQKFAESLPKIDEKNPDEIQKEINNLEAAIENLPENHKKVNEFKASLDAAQGALEASQNAWNEMVDALDPSDIRQTLRHGLIAVQGAIDEAEATANAFGFGSEPGQDGYTSAEAKLAVAEKIKNNPKLVEIAKLAGRFRREARKQQANKKKPGPDELTDIECGNDLGRVIPSELMLLNDEMGELVFFKKYLECSLIQYKLEEAPHENRGPIVICLDNSGSMSGIPEIWSKAIALAMSQIAIDQKRSVKIIHFNSDVARVDTFPVGDINPEQLIESCAFFSGGGTLYEPVLQEAFVTIMSDADKGFKKADVVFVTDGICDLEEKALEVIQTNKKESEASIYSIVIGPKEENTILHEISDSVDFIEDFTDASDKDIKEKIFSI